MADYIDRQKQPLRLYRPGWLTYDSLYTLKNDLDRELELISRSLLSVTQRLDTIEEVNRILLRQHTYDPSNPTDTISIYLKDFLWDKSADPHETDPTHYPTPDPSKWKTLWPDKSLKGAKNG